MESQEIIERAKMSLGGKVDLTEVTLGDAVLHTTPQNLVAVVTFIKEDQDIDCDYLSYVSGVDYLEQDREPRFESVYEFHSVDKGHSVRVRVGIDEDEMAIPTISHIWKGALFPERELFDMFGFKVTGHPEQRRLIMPEEWEGHPLQKDHPLVTEDVAFSHNPDHKSELIQTKPEPEEWT